MALVELSVIKQRYDSVMAVLQGGWKIVEVAERMGFDKKWDAYRRTAGAISTPPSTG